MIIVENVGAGIASKGEESSQGNGNVNECTQPKRPSNGLAKAKNTVILEFRIIAWTIVMHDPRIEDHVQKGKYGSGPGLIALSKVGLKMVWHIIVTSSALLIRAIETTDNHFNGGHDDTGSPKDREGSKGKGARTSRCFKGRGEE